MPPGKKNKKINDTVALDNLYNMIGAETELGKMLQGAGSKPIDSAFWQQGGQGNGMQLQGGYRNGSGQGRMQGKLGSFFGDIQGYANPYTSAITGANIGYEPDEETQLKLGYNQGRYQEPNVGFQFKRKF